MQATLIKAELDRLRMTKLVSIRDVAATLASGQVAYSNIKAAISNRAYAPARSVHRAMQAASQASMDMLLGEATAYLPAMLGRLDALYIDEFQDSAAGDFSLLEGIEAKSKTVVGDEMQSIFGFRGSSPDYFRHLAASHDWQQLTLADNYRSNAAIVDAANRLTAGQAGAIAMRHIRPDDWTQPTIANHGTESAEFAHIREWLASHPTGSRAILCRHNALAARLRLALADMLPPSPALALDPAMIRQAIQAVQEGTETMDAIRKWHAVLPYIKHFGEMCGGDVDTMLAAMAEALAQAEAQAAYDFGGLYIGTVHGAKGLEWDHVLIAGVEQAAWPSTAEMLRLFYVAITRARDSLTITAAGSRASLHGRGRAES
jgi:DNA helicase-2/ATP-dependent DNA helicase PcrA